MTYGESHSALRRDIAQADQYAVEAQARGDTHRYQEERAIGDALRGQLWHAEHPLREGEPDLTGHTPDSNLTPRQWWDDR